MTDPSSPPSDAPDAPHPSKSDDPPVRIPLPDTRAGDRIVWASWVGTALFALSAVPAAIAPSTFVAPFVFVSLGMFALGTLAFFVAYAGAVSRSRTDLIGIGGLFFLAGTAPSRVRRQLMASLAIEVVVGVTAASVRVYTPLAFGILAPMYGLGLSGLWASRHGVFAPRGAPAGDA